MKKISLLVLVSGVMLLASCGVSNISFNRNDGLSKKSHSTISRVSGGGSIFCKH